MIYNFPFTINDTTKLLVLKYNVDNLKINSVNELDLVNAFHNVDSPLLIDNTTKNVKLDFDSTDFTVKVTGLSISPTGKSVFESCF